MLLKEGLAKKIKSEYGYTSEEIVDEAISRYMVTWPYVGIVILNVVITLIASTLFISLHHFISTTPPVNP